MTDDNQSGRGGEVKTFDEAGRELAIKHIERKYHAIDVNMSGPGATDFLAGRDSCKEALRVACEALKHYEAAWDGKAAKALKLVQATGCYVGEE